MTATAKDYKTGRTGLDGQTRILNRRAIQLMGVSGESAWVPVADHPDKPKLSADEDAALMLERIGECPKPSFAEYGQDHATASCRATNASAILPISQTPSYIIEHYTPRT